MVSSEAYRTTQDERNKINKEIEGIFMKRIFLVLMLLPLSSFAMEENPVVVTVTRDGAADQKTEIFTDQKEQSLSLFMFDRDYKSTIKYTVNLTLLKIQQGKASIKYSVDTTIDTEDRKVTRSGEMSIARGRMNFKGAKVEQVIPVNIRHVQELKSHDKQPATLGLTVIHVLDGTHAKL